MSATATATRSGATAVVPPNPRPRRRRTAVVAGLAALVVLLTAGWLLWFSSVFAARQVTVAGTQELTARHVQDAAQVPLGRPLARLDLQAIAERTARVPQVATARATRSWPGTVRVSVVERRPLLAVPQPGGYLIVDRTGLAYESRKAVPAGVLTVQVNPDNRDLLTQVGIVADALPASLWTEVKRVEATSPDAITLTLDSGVVIRWGSSVDSVLKAEVTSVLLERDPRVSIDVSSPHNPAIR